MKSPILTALRRVVGFSPLAIIVLLLTAIAVSQVPNREFEKTLHEGSDAMRAGHLDEAAAHFSRAIELAPAVAETHFNLGLVRFQQGRLDEASSLFNKALGLNPRLRGANLFLGIAAYRKNSYDAALSALRRETKIDPRNAVAYMWIGVTQLAAGDSHAAALTLDKAFELDPHNVDILYHRGRAYMKVSEDSYQRMYEADPKSWRIHQALAQAYVKADRLEEAVRQGLEAIELKPDEPGLHEELADIYWDQNQLASAESEFQKELKLDPESLSSMYKLGVVSLEHSKPEVAEQLLGEVVKRSPNTAEAHYQLGRAQVQVGKVDEAIVSFSAAVADSAHSANYSHRDSPDDVLRQSYYQLAQLYRRVYRTEEARTALEAFLRLKQGADVQRAQTFEDKLRRSGESSNSTQ